MRLIASRSVGLVLAALLFASCAGANHPRSIRPGQSVGVPATLELFQEARVASLHFPAGSYSLAGTDAIGYYYQAVRRVRQRSGGGEIARTGGVFVSRSDRTKLRGYVYFAGAVTHAGNLSHIPHAFRD
jgi:hypothetical protein